MNLAVDLSETLAAVLRESAFENRYMLHPRRLAGIGKEVVESFLRFAESRDPAAASELGARLAGEGFGGKTALKLASGLRLFCRKHPSGNSGVPADLPDAAESYTYALLEGFLTGWEAKILADQENLRRALSTALADRG